MKMKFGKSITLKEYTPISPFLVLFMVIVTIYCFKNLLTLIDIQSSNYKTPWYSQSWIDQPVINLLLSFKPSNIYWTKNAIGSQVWLVKETEFQDKKYWTLVERHILINKDKVN